MSTTVLPAVTADRALQGKTGCHLQLPPAVIEDEMQSLCAALAVVVFGVAQSRLVFPTGSDIGYIVPDDPEPETFEDNANFLRDIEDRLAEPLREDSSNLKSTIRSLLHSGVREAERSIADEGWHQADTYRNWGERPEQPPEGFRASPPEDLPDSMKDDKHGVAMGIPHIKCDNAKINITIDWDYSPINYTCFDPRHHRIPVQNIKSVEKCTDLPDDYTPQHICMNQKLFYNTTLPTFGPHRPLWPVFGEYKFVPVQRWLHSIEHGGIVMLYDPCAEPLLVNQLRKVLKGCFRKHIITPYTLLTKDRPLALLAWGCSLEMATVDEAEVKAFIKTRALHGPEGHYPKDGSFKEGLLHRAVYPSAVEKDSIICPE